MVHCCQCLCVFFWHGAGHLSHSSILASKGGTETEHHVVVIFLSFLGRLDLVAVAFHRKRWQKVILWRTSLTGVLLIDMASLHLTIWTREVLHFWTFCVNVKNQILTRLITECLQVSGAISWGYQVAPLWRFCTTEAVSRLKPCFHNGNWPWIWSCSSWHQIVLFHRLI